MSVRIGDALRFFVWLVWGGASLAGCVHVLDAQPDPESLKASGILGHVLVWQAEGSGRIFPPELASFECEQIESGERYQITVAEDAAFFIASLSPGRYHVTRVIMREGEFRSMAEVPLQFDVPVDGFAYLGKWSLQLEPPNFTRELVVTVQADWVEAVTDLRLRYPGFEINQVETQLAEPTMVRARLYEMTPYPRFRWFNRHNST